MTQIRRGYLLLLCGLALFLLVRPNQQTNPLVKCETTKGPIVIEVHRNWAPLGAQRFLDLVADEFFHDIGFYRCVRRFLTQFGISDNPTKKHWHMKQIMDDPNLHMGIKKGYVSFAGGGPNTRSTQMFIAFEDLDFLGKDPWETPFGEVIEGQSTLDALYKGYGDMPPFGKGPNQQKIFNRGNAYLREEFPNIDFIEMCRIVGDEEGGSIAELPDMALPKESAAHAHVHDTAAIIEGAGAAVGDETAVDLLQIVKCDTTKGPLTIEVHREWAPLGADRFLELVADDFFHDIGFFRCVRRFLTQFGISENPTKKHWHNDNIKDDPNLHMGIKKGYVSFAGGGPNTRSTQLFIAFEDLDFLGKEPWETPFAKVIEGQSTLDALYKGYGDIPPFGKGPNQQKIHNRGNAYLKAEFPLLDYINSCWIDTPAAGAAVVMGSDGANGIHALPELEIPDAVHSDQPAQLADVHSVADSVGGLAAGDGNGDSATAGKDHAKHPLKAVPLKAVPIKAVPLKSTPVKGSTQTVAGGGGGGGGGAAVGVHGNSEHVLPKAVPFKTAKTAGDTGASNGGGSVSSHEKVHRAVPARPLKRETFEVKGLDSSHSERKKDNTEDARKQSTQLSMSEADSSISPADLAAAAAAAASVASEAAAREANIKFESVVASAGGELIESSADQTYVICAALGFLAGMIALLFLYVTYVSPSKVIGSAGKVQ